MLRLCCCRPLERCFGRWSSGGGGDSLVWHKDLNPHPSGQFSMAVAQANFSLEDQSQVLTSTSATYIGVFDGHGGPQASTFVNNRLLPYLHEMASEEGGVSGEVIRKAFSATEEEFLRSVKRSLGVTPQIGFVGSCCLVGVISNTDNVLYVANLGDSRAVLGRRPCSSSSSAAAQRLSVDHNVGVEEIRKEVEALHPDDSPAVLHRHGVWRIKGIIQVSRSIGDAYLKRPDLYRVPVSLFPIPLNRPVMTAEPSIIVRNLEPQDMFLIFASDGLWEQLSDEAAVNIVFKYPRTGIAKRLVKAALEEAAKKEEKRYDEIKKMEKGTRRRFHDDITVIVVYLDHHHKGSSSKQQSAVGCCTTAPVDICSLNEEEDQEAEQSMLGGAVA